MKYLALGDSMSIDRYTDVVGGGAASQFAQLVGADEFVDLADDGCTTYGVLTALKQVTDAPDIVTLTIGGNDLLLAVLSAPEGVAPSVGPILGNLVRIAARLSELGSFVIMNTVYDPTDGNDTYAKTIGIKPINRLRLQQLNSGIESIAHACGFAVLRVHELFLGHGEDSAEPFLTKVIEPNLAGATAIAREWHRLVTEAGLVPATREREGIA